MAAMLRMAKSVQMIVGLQYGGDAGIVVYICTLTIWYFFVLCFIGFFVALLAL